MLPSSTLQEEFPASRPSHQDFDPVAEIRRLRRELAESVSMLNAFATNAAKSPEIAGACGMPDDAWREGDVVRYASRAALVPMIATSRSRLAELAEFSPRLDPPPLHPLESQKRKTVEQLASSTPVTHYAEKKCAVDTAVWVRNWASHLRSIQTPAHASAPLQPRRRLCQFSAAFDSPATSHWAIDGAVIFTLLGVAAIVLGSLLYLRGHQAAQGNIEILGLQIGCIGAVVLAVRLVGEALTPKAL